MRESQILFYSESGRKNFERVVYIFDSRKVLLAGSIFLAMIVHDGAKKCLEKFVLINLGRSCRRHLIYLTCAKKFDRP